MPLLPLLLILITFCACRPTDALAPESHRVELFKRGVSTVPFEYSQGKTVNRVVHSYRIPWLGDVDGVMVAIADARYVSSNDNSFIETVVKYSVDDGKTWETQVAIKNSRVSRVSRIVDPTVLVRGNKLYVLVGRYNTSTTYWIWHADGRDWEPLLVVGEVKKSSVNGKVTANITWTKPVSLKSILPSTIAGSPSKQFLGGVSGALVTRNGTFLIPVQVTNYAKRIYSTLIRSDDDGKNWAFVKGLAGPGFSEPAIVEWEGKLILSARYDGHYRMFYESTDMGETWTEALGTLSRVWGTSPKRNQPGSQSSFITVTIEGKRVMLFTHPLNFHGRWLRDRLRLWVTDNNRIFDVGQVSIGDEDTAYSSLLYKNDKLYCLHEINTKEVYSLVFAELIGELERIKHVIRTWKEMDAKISRRCVSTAEKRVQPTNDCATNIPTDGLVGFLSTKFTNDKWEDEYLCVNATVKGAITALNGLTFKGSRSWAEWPVSKQGQNQRYYFVNNAFTLVATVSIHDVPTKDSPLLGVALDSSGNKLFGLMYTSDQKWSVIYGRARALLAEGRWTPNATYQVALILRGGEGSVYVDGNLLKEPKRKIPGLHKTRDISHFYFGSFSDKDTTYVSVTDVVLYNRPLDTNQLKALLQMKVTTLYPQAGGDTLDPLLAPPDLRTASSVQPTAHHSEFEERQRQTVLPLTDREGNPASNEGEVAGHGESGTQVTSSTKGISSPAGSALTTEGSFDNTGDIFFGLLRQNKGADSAMCAHVSLALLLLLSLFLVTAS